MLSRDRPSATVALAFATLFTMMTAHALLESARDALLLGALSPSALLWSYVAIALLAVLATRLRRSRQPASLPSMLIAASVLTSIFWLFLPRLMPVGAMAFYVYTGILATLVVPRFWLALAAGFTVGEAKRWYSAIGLGGVAGAGAGSALASFLLARISVHGLVLAGALVYLVGALVARRFDGTLPTAKPARALQARSTEPTSYVRRLTALALVASATLTIVDYLFKSVIASTVPAAELGSYFARFYTWTNVVALFVQLFLVPRVLKSLGTHAATILLPALLLASTGSFVFLSLPVLMLAAKGADGVLRNSLHRVTMELFYFPLPDEARNRWKAAADAVGQRGGQAAGALATLGVLALGAEQVTVAIFASAMTIVWIALALSVRRPYVELFRASLRRGSILANVPPLGSQTLQAMLEALSSADDAVVCAALDFLALRTDIRLVPAAMVYHPSPTVATRALAHLVTAHRSDVPRLIERLTTHPNPEIRVSALRTQMRQGASDGRLLEALDDSDLDVRATAIVKLHARPEHQEHASALIASIALGSCARSKLALARAIGEEARSELAGCLLQLLETPDVAVRNEVLTSMAAVPSRAYLPRILPLLGDRRLLPNARRAVLASSFGDSSTVEEWLEDETLPRSVRRHIPRTLSAFDSERAAAALLARLAKEADGAVRYKILRGLGRMRSDHPTLKVDERLLRKLAEENLKRAIDLLAWRVALANDTPTTLEIVLRSMLHDKEERALERVFRILGILHPDGELEHVWRGIHSTDPRSRDASLELVDELERKERGSLLAMLEPKPDDERLRAVGRRPIDRDRALRDLASDSSAPLREIARFLLGGVS